MSNPGYDLRKFPEKTDKGNVEFYLKRKDSSTVSVWAEKNEILADAITRKDEKMNLKTMLFWVKLTNRDGKKFVNPFFLPCGLIQMRTEVEWKEITGDIYDYDIEQKYCRAYNKPRVPFFISNTNQSRGENMTYVGRRKIGLVDICVVAIDGENFEKALKSDGRFKGVERFILSRKVEGGKGSVVDKTDSPADLAGDYLEVKVRRSTAQSQSTSLDESKIASTSEETSTRGDVSTFEENSFETPKEKRERKLNFDKLASELWKKNRLYVFPEDDDELTFQEKRERMEECLKARAWCTLLGPSDRARSKFEKSLKKHGKIQFSNNNIVSRPVAFSKNMYHLYSSIGFLKCGDMNATCFLISNNLIATNWHVVDDIWTARRSSTQTDHSIVFVNFGYELGEENVQDRYTLAPLEDEGNVTSEDLDYAFLHVEGHVEGEALGKHVRTDIPCQGKVCIVGHPDGKVKQEEICPIIPQNDDRKSLQYEKNLADGQQYRSNLSSDTFYMYRENVKKNLHNDGKTLTYDVGSMFQGSSGAPVFNMRCQIVALHTLGFYIEDSMAIEAGVTFAAIIRDLNANGHEKFVEKHFPFCVSKEESMETD